MDTGTYHSVHDLLCMTISTQLITRMIITIVLAIITSAMVFVFQINPIFLLINGEIFDKLRSKDNVTASLLEVSSVQTLKITIT